MNTITEITIIAGIPSVGKSSFLGILQGTCEWLPDIVDEDMIDGSGVSVQERICAIIRNYVQWELPLTVKNGIIGSVDSWTSVCKIQGLQDQALLYRYFHFGGMHCKNRKQGKEGEEHPFNPNGGILLPQPLEGTEKGSSVMR